jgi:hypothetical protein
MFSIKKIEVGSVRKISGYKGTWREVLRGGAKSSD